MKKIVSMVLLVALLMLGLASAASAQATDHCPDHQSVTKFEGAYNSLILDTDTEFCVKAGPQATGKLVADGARSLTEYVRDSGIRVGKGNVPSVSYYVVYGDVCDDNEDAPFCKGDSNPPGGDPVGPVARDHGSVIPVCTPGFNVFLDVATGFGDWTITFAGQTETFTVAPDEVSDITFLSARGFEVSRDELPFDVLLVRGDDRVFVDATVTAADVGEDCVPPTIDAPTTPVEPVDPPTTAAPVDDIPVDRTPVTVTEVPTQAASADELPRTGTSTPLALGLAALLLGAGTVLLRRTASA